MDYSLRCNALHCRANLLNQAVVTTCSHIFCIPCSQLLHRSTNDGIRVCPACQTSLPNIDDAVKTQLNPSEDYKTSILSGFSPSVVLDCASRGLSFWSYQTTQEIVYQEYLTRMLKERLQEANTQLDKVSHDANAEIEMLRNKLSGAQLAQQGLERQTQQLADALREKTRKHNQMQELYNKLKQRTLYTHVQSAAANAVDQSVRDEVGSSHVANDGRNDGLVVEPLHGAGLPLPLQDTGSRYPGEHRVMAQPQSYPRGGEVGVVRSESLPHPPGPDPADAASRYSSTVMPDQHRQPLPVLSRHGDTIGPPGTIHAQPNTYAPTPRASRGQALASMQPYVASTSALAGYGMSAGVKLGRAAETVSSRNEPRLGPVRAAPAFPRS